MSSVLKIVILFIASSSVFLLVQAECGTAIITSTTNPDVYGECVKAYSPDGTLENVCLYPEWCNPWNFVPLFSYTYTVTFGGANQTLDGGYILERMMNADKKEKCPRSKC